MLNYHKAHELVTSPYLVHQFLERSVDLNPNADAVVTEKSRFSYREIECRANSIANWLLNIGCNKGDRVAILLKNSADYICAYYGVLKTGCVVVPLNTGLESKEISEIITDCGAKVLISQSLFVEKIMPVFKTTSIPCKFIAMDENMNIIKKHINDNYFNLSDIYSTYNTNRPAIKVIAMDLSSIMYTSGSTGKPKGAMLTHLNIVSNTISIVSYMKLSSKDRCFVILPFYYVFGKSLLNTHFAVSGMVVIDNRFAYPNVVLERMIEENVTGFAGVPSTYALLLNKSAIYDMEFPALRFIAQAGGHMPEKNKEKLLKIFPDKNIYIMYGATEASARLSYFNLTKRSDKIKSIGQPIPNVELKVLGENEKELSFGKEGEIVAKGSNIMLGYWNDPVETEKVLKNGLYYTGDLGFKDEEGFLFVTGRKRDFIKSGIYKVSGIEIEEVLHTYPGVQEAAVIGVPDEFFGEAIKAFVVHSTEKELDTNDILRFCANLLPHYKVPGEIIFIKELPKNEAGKVLKKKLKEMV